MPHAVLPPSLQGREETTQKAGGSESSTVRALPSAPLRVLDFGTGSGCLLLALLSELPNAAGTGVDLAVGAARQARANARALGLADRASFVVGDWGAPIAGRAAVILSNPPYIKHDA